MVKDLNDIMTGSPAPRDGTPRGTRSNISEVQIKVERREPLLQKTTAIEKALSRIPEEYQARVWNNIQERRAYPMDADRTTYGRWKSRFIRYVAVYLGMVPEDW